MGRIQTMRKLSEDFGMNAIDEGCSTQQRLFKRAKLDMMKAKKPRVVFLCSGRKGRGGGGGMRSHVRFVLDAYTRFLGGEMRSHV
eukprot:4980816-Amphidinium_carterae.1